MRTLLLSLAIFAAFTAFGQPFFHLNTNIPVEENGNTLLHPWAGGMNFPVFSSVDINGDGLVDLFSFDRSNNRAEIFINTGTGGAASYRYAPEFAEQLPALRGWALFYDYNCDGKADLFTTGTSNNGILQFRNDSPTGSLHFTAVDSSMKADYGGGSMAGIFASGFLMPHLNDVDGDGDMDVIGQQFFCVGTFAYYKNLSMENYGVCDSLDKYVLDTYAWGKFALRTGAYSNVAVGQYNISCFMATPPQDMFTYEEAVQDDTYAGLYTLDIDGDGDMDALIGDSGARNSLLVINGGSSVTANMVSQDTLFPSYNTPVNINAFTNHAYLDADHDGVKDLLVSHNEYENKKGVWYYKNTGTNSIPVFDLMQNDFLENQMIDVGEGAAPVFFDADADGLADLIIGNLYKTDTAGVQQHGLSYYRNNGTAANPSFMYITDDYAGISAYPIAGPLMPAFGDIDGDGDEDMLIGTQTGEMYWFENTAGAGMPASFSFVSSSFFGIDVGNYCSPEIIDLNRDGVKDLVIGKKSGVIAYYQNTGSASVPNFSSVPTKDTLGGINVQTPGYVDGYSVPFVYEDSGQYMMMVACMKGDVYLYGGIEGNILGNYIPMDTIISRINGVKTTFNLSISGADINNDNRTDLVLGLYGGGVQIYMQDTLAMGTGMNQDQQLFEVYPNPADERVYLKLLQKSNYALLSITDLTGRLVLRDNLSQTNHRIDVTSLAEGMYFMSLESKNLRSTQRLIIVHK